MSAGLDSTLGCSILSSSQRAIQTFVRGTGDIGGCGPSCGDTGGVHKRSVVLFSQNFGFYFTTLVFSGFHIRRFSSFVLSTKGTLSPVLYTPVLHESRPEGWWRFLPSLIWKVSQTPLTEGRGIFSCLLFLFGGVSPQLVPPRPLRSQMEWEVRHHEF